jgi:hypothetical protein
MFLPKWIISALSIPSFKDQSVYVQEGLEKIQTFRAFVKAEFVSLESLLIENDERFKDEFSLKVKKQVKEFISAVEANPWPDPRLLERAGRYLNHLNTYPITLESRHGISERLINICGDNISLVQEPPNILKHYESVIPASFYACKQVITSNYYYNDAQLVDFATKNETWTECLKYSSDMREIELEAYQNLIDKFIVAVIEARK